MKVQEDMEDELRMEQDQQAALGKQLKEMRRKLREASDHIH